MLLWSMQIGGFPEDFGYALEDWELFSKVVLGGYHLETIPDPLYWYRLRETSHSRVTGKHGNPARTIRPYLKKIPQHLHHLVMFAQVRNVRPRPTTRNSQRCAISLYIRTIHTPT